MIVLTDFSHWRFVWNESQINSAALFTRQMWRWYKFENYYKYYKNRNQLGLWINILNLSAHHVIIIIGNFMPLWNVTLVWRSNTLQIKLSFIIFCVCIVWRWSPRQPFRGSISNARAQRTLFSLVYFLLLN